VHAVPVELTATVVRDDAGRPEYFLSGVRDLRGPDALS
jgi:hypothetical protein